MEREHFTIDPSEDSGLYFGRKELAETLRRQIRKSFAFGKPPKALLWGDWGVGKTHALYHVRYFLETNEEEYPSAVYFVEFGDVTKKSRFDTLHQKMLDAIGREKLNDLLQKFMAANPETQFTELLRRRIGSSDMVSAFFHLTVTQLQTAQSSAAWEWLLGLGLDTQRLRNLGISRNLNDSSDMVTVIKFIGKLFREVEERRLIFLLDEGAKLDNVTDPDAEAHWINAWKELSDDLNVDVGFFVTGSFRRQEDIPLALSDEQILNRLGEENVIELPLFERTDAEQFLQDLLRELKDPKCVDKLLDGLETEADDIDRDLLPFTKEAFDLFVEYVIRVAQEAAPRLILQKLDDLAFEAFEQEKRLIDGTFLRGLGLA